MIILFLALMMSAQAKTPTQTALPAGRICTPVPSEGPHGPMLPQNGKCSKGQKAVTGSDKKVMYCLSTAPPQPRVECKSVQVPGNAPSR